MKDQFGRTSRRGRDANRRFNDEKTVKRLASEQCCRAAIKAAIN